MTAQELVKRWLGSEHGETPEREAKAKGRAKACNIAWSDVLIEAEKYRAAHPPEDTPEQ